MIFLYLLQNFLGPPKVRLKDPTENQRIIYGNTIVLEAEVFAIPPLTEIRWEKDKKVINPNDKKMSKDYSNKDILKLIIDNADFDDSGTYSITVTNVLDSDEDYTDLNIEVEGKTNLSS